MVYFKTRNKVTLHQLSVPARISGLPIQSFSRVFVFARASKLGEKRPLKSLNISGENLKAHVQPAFRSLKGKILSKDQTWRSELAEQEGEGPSASCVALCRQPLGRITPKESQRSCTGKEEICPGSPLPLTLL